MTTISVITPTIGRESLATMLGKLLPQLGPGDEVLVVGDGPQPVAREVVQRLASPLVQYWEHGPLWNWGNPQRNAAMARARGDYVAFLDDDDEPADGWAEAIRRAAAERPGRPLMFRMHHPGTVLWRTPKLEMANVSGQMFVAPNVPGRLGRWGGKYAADLGFMTDTLALYPEGEAAVAWREEVIAVQGYAGPGVIGHEPEVSAIYLDLDGVLADFVSAALKAHGKDPAAAMEAWPCGEYDAMFGVVGVDEDAFWDRINAWPPWPNAAPEGSHFWEKEIQAYPWADGLWDLCEGLAPTWVLTAPSRHAGSSYGKVKWLQKWRGERFRNYVMAPRKWHLARPGALLVDDDPKNVGKWIEGGGDAVLFPRPWNGCHALSGEAMEVAAREIASRRFSGNPRGPGA